MGHGRITPIWHCAMIAVALGIASGCGSKEPKSAEAPKTDAKTAAGKAADSAAKAADDDQVVRVDANGRKWLGKVPYDVFFDEPLEVASEGGGMKEDTAPSAKGATKTAPTPAQPATQPTTPAASDWKPLIDGDALTAELKRLRVELTGYMQSIGQFNAHVADVEVAAATLAVVAAIGADHSDAPSWKKNAIAIRDIAGKLQKSASKPGKDSFQAATTEFAALSSVLDGNPPAAASEAGAVRDLSEVAERAALMKRMERTIQWLKKNADSDAALKKQQERAIEEGSLLSALSRAVVQGHYDAADDAKYRQLGEELTTAAAELTRACRDSDKSALFAALSGVQKRCDACHAAFRFE